MTPTMGDRWQAALTAATGVGVRDGRLVSARCRFLRCDLHPCSRRYPHARRTDPALSSAAEPLRLLGLAQEQVWQLGESAAFRARRAPQSFSRDYVEDVATPPWTARAGQLAELFLRAPSAPAPLSPSPVTA